MRTVLLSIDGLAIDDLPDLVDLLPKSGRALKSLPLKRLMAGPLKGAQPLWAEILTAKPWSENGCAGYSRPGASLNSLAVFEEQDLVVGTLLLDNESDESKSLLVNVPLLKPKKATRLWLSDGSMPLNTLVSPARLKSDEPFDRYKPRAFNDIVQALGYRTSISDSCIEHEEHRLACAIKLLREEPWQRAIIRLSLFDQLSHLIGVKFLSGVDLAIAEKLRQFLTKLDDLIAELFSWSNTVVALMSAYSHVVCQGRVNLSNILAMGGYLQLESADSAFRGGTQRQAATVATGGYDNPIVLRSSEGRIATNITSAASPVAACIYLNSKDRFTDGIVDEEEHPLLLARVGEFLRNTLGSRFAGRANIIENPRPMRERNRDRTPDLVVSIEGVEFVDVQDPGMSDLEVPRTTHGSGGFLLLPHQVAFAADSLELRQIREVFRDF